MARERIDIMVEDIEYSYCQISPTKATLVFLRLVKIFGPALGTALGGKLPTAGEARNMAVSLKDIDLTKIIETVTDRMEEEEIMAMARKLLSNTYPKKGGPKLVLGTETSFDAHFDETPGLFHMFKVVKEVLWLQYADFFAGIGTLDKPEQSAPAIESPMVP